MGLSQRVSKVFGKLIGTENTAAEPGVEKVKQILNILLVRNLDQQTIDKCVGITNFEYFLVNLENTSLIESKNFIGTIRQEF